MPIPSAEVLGDRSSKRPDDSESCSYTLAILAGELSPEDVRDVLHGNAGYGVRVVAVSSVATGRVEGRANVLPAVLAAAAEALGESGGDHGNSARPGGRAWRIEDDGGRSGRSGERGRAGEAPDPDQSPGLSARERETLLLVADGLTRNQAARRIGISPHTVDTYLKRIRAKLGLGNKAELARAAERYRHDGDRRP
ncbi:helix-turn-helix transcriptional regulator [Streptomyces sp. NPDC031705]|uniref:response regulator transcription factor n=1 Tax=Streptomyces sp. NPDC031705 TaxID=3155729 RepID=UPI00340E094A